MSNSMPLAERLLRPIAGSSSPVRRCRLCGGQLQHDLVDFGDLPQSLIGAGEARYRLRVMMCQSCGLVQTAHEPPPHRPSAWKTPCGRDAADITALLSKWRPNADARVINVDSDDTAALSDFAAPGTFAMAIRAPFKTAENARQPGCDCEIGLLSVTSAMDVATRIGRAALVIVGNALTMVPDLFDFAAGLAALVRPDGVVSITVPHLLSIMQQIQLDTFDHDTRYYFSLSALETLLCSVGLRVFDAERLADGEGQLRVHACPTTARFTARSGLRTVRLAETLAATGRSDIYANFSQRVACARQQIGEFLSVRQAAGRSVAGFGVTRRSIMLLNICGISTETVSCVAGETEMMVGAVLPGTLLPVVPRQTLLDLPPHDLLLLSKSGNADGLHLARSLSGHGTQSWTMLPRLSRIDGRV